MTKERKTRELGYMRAAQAKHELNQMVSLDLLYLVADPTLQTAGERWVKSEEQFQKDTMANQLQWSLA